MTGMNRDSILDALATEGQAADVYRLAELLGTGVQNVLPLLDAMEADGLIERDAAGSASLTPDGSSAIVASLTAAVFPEQARDALVAAWTDTEHAADCRAAMARLGITGHHWSHRVRTPARPQDPGLVAAYAAWAAERSVPSSVALVASSAPAGPAGARRGFYGPNHPISRARRMDRALALVAAPDPTPGSLVASFSPVEPDCTTCPDALAAAATDGEVWSWSDPVLNKQRRRARLAELLEGHA